MPENGNGTVVAPSIDFYPDADLKEMVDAGVFYGRKRTKTNPKMRSYILGNRNEIEFFDLQKTQEMLERAAQSVKDAVRSGKAVLFVGTQPAAADIAKIAREFGMPFVAKRWLGGTLTNFAVIAKRIEYFKKLKGDRASGALEKYTKKERLEFDRELRRLEELLAGIEPMQELPGMLVVVDPMVHSTAIRETRRLGIPVVALVNTDADPELVSHPVPGNNKARSSIVWFLENIAEAVREGIAERASEKERESQKTEERAAIENNKQDITPGAA